MSEQEIIEGNRLIAEFMNIKIQKNSDGQKSIILNGYRFNFCILNYYKSWDWLMPVVEKIGIMYEDLYKQAFITKTPISYDIETTYADVICRHVTIKIEHLFERVVEFIKWYNLCQKEK